jgi:hypothetical protein
MKYTIVSIYLAFTKLNERPHSPIREPPPHTTAVDILTLSLTLLPPYRHATAASAPPNSCGRFV